jgi:hypothetical protein
VCNEDDVFGGIGHIAEKVNELDKEGSKSASCASNSMHNAFLGENPGSSCASNSMHYWKGAKLYAKATELLKDLYDGNDVDLSLFLQQVKTRSEVFGWTHILAAPPDIANLDETMDLIQHYSELNLEQVRAFTQTYINNQARAAQDDAQLYHCLCKSLTKEAETNIVLFQEDDTIGDQSCGLALLKVIVHIAYKCACCASGSKEKKLAFYSVGAYNLSECLRVFYGKQKKYTIWQSVDQKSIQFFTVK